MMARASGDVLIRIESSTAVPLTAAAPPLNVSAAGTTFAFEPLFEVPLSPTTKGAVGLGAPGRAVWHRARATGTTVGSSWDAAHEVARQANASVAARGARVSHVEPDLIQEWPTE